MPRSYPPVVVHGLRLVACGVLRVISRLLGLGGQWEFCVEHKTTCKQGIVAMSASTEDGLRYVLTNPFCVVVFGAEYEFIRI